MNVWKFSAGLSLILVVALAVLLAWGQLFRPILEEGKGLEAKKAELEGRVAELEAQVKDLREKQERLESDPRFVEKIAREDLGFAKEGETVFKFVEDTP